MLPALNMYYVSTDQEIRGPYTEGNLLQMYKSGQIPMTALVSLVGSEEWVPVHTEVSTIEAFRPSVIHEKRRTMSYEEGKQYSPGMAAGLSLLITGLGHFYADAAGRGAFLLLLQMGLGFAGLWPLILIVWIAAPIDAYQVARKKSEG